MSGCGGALFAGRCFLEILSAFHYQSHLPVKSLLMLGSMSEALTLLAWPTAIYSSLESRNFHRIMPETLSQWKNNLSSLQQMRKITKTISDTCREVFIFHYPISRHPYSVAIIAITEQMRSGGSEMYTELVCGVIQRIGPRVRPLLSSHCGCVMLCSPHLWVCFLVCWMEMIVTSVSWSFWVLRIKCKVCRVVVGSNKSSINKC